MLGRRVYFAVCLLSAAACSGGGGTNALTGTGPGTGTTTGSGDTLTITLTLHGLTGTENLENVAVAVGPNTIPRGSATAAQLQFFSNRNGAGADATFPIQVPKGQSITLYATEEQGSWGDNTPAPPFYHPQPADTAVDGAAIEFASWSNTCASPSFGDCQLANVQSNAQITANFQRLKSLNVQVVGVGQLVRTIQTRPPLSIAPVLTTNPINSTDTIPESIFFDSASADAYEVALFSGSQITLVETEPQHNGFTVTYDGWSGGCTSMINATCIVKWPPSAGGSFVYSGGDPVPPPQARFQWWKCTAAGTPQAAQGANVTLPTWSCALQKP